MNTKKGAMPIEYTVALVIIGVLAVIVIVYLGVQSGWFSNIFSGFRTSNIDSATQACALACASNSKFDFCCKKWNIKVDSSFTAKDITCQSNLIKPVDCSIECADYIASNSGICNPTSGALASSNPSAANPSTSNPSSGLTTNKPYDFKDNILYSGVEINEQAIITSMDQIAILKIQDIGGTQDEAIA